MINIYIHCILMIDIYIYNVYSYIVIKTIHKSTICSEWHIQSILVAHYRGHRLLEIHRAWRSTCRIWLWVETLLPCFSRIDGK